MKEKIIKEKIMKEKELVKQMTLDEKISLCSGKNWSELAGIKRLELPEIVITDSLHALHSQIERSNHKFQAESTACMEATCFPTASALACSFDTELIREMGAALGEECRKSGVSVLFGPEINIKRSPLGGRNYECFSEDPLLTGKMASSMIEGVQSKNVGMAIKHFGANNQETRKMSADMIIDERAFREIYLRSFEIAIKSARPWMVMTAYNGLGDGLCSENRRLLTDILSTEWGYEGTVVSDWRATNDRVKGMLNGMHLEIPGNRGNDKLIKKAVKTWKLPVQVLDKATERILHIILAANQNTQIEPDMKAHHELAKRIALESAVLLKNEEDILPGNIEQKVAVIGMFAKNPRCHEPWSSRINFDKIECAMDAFALVGVNAEYAQGYSLNDEKLNDEKPDEELDEILLDEACKAAMGKDIVYLFIGLPEASEAKGRDRSHLQLPKQHNELVERIARLNPNLVVVLQGGAPMEMPWINKAKGVLMCYLSGESGASACVDLLLGRQNPCGKLAETFPIALEDTPCYNYFPGNTSRTEYRESIFVGYRYYETAQCPVLFPFGHGLSYTKFQYSDMETITIPMGIGVSCTVTNTGSVEGKEVVQLYISRKDSSFAFKVSRELKAFKKIRLGPGESKKLKFDLTINDFAYYNCATKGWHTENGFYEISCGRSVADIRLSSEIKISNQKQQKQLNLREKAKSYYDLPKTSMIIPDKEFAVLLGKPMSCPELVPKEKFNRNTTVRQISKTLLGKKVYAGMNRKSMKMAGDNPYMQKVISEMMLDLPLRTFFTMTNRKMAPPTIDKIAKILAIGRKK